MKGEKERKMKIKYIDPWDLGFMMGAIILIGGIFSFILMTITEGDFMGINLSREDTLQTPFGLIILMILMSFISFCTGYLQGLVIALVYNFIANKRGGVEIRVSE